MRERIIRATLEEVNLRGFKFTMNDIVKRLSISKSSLYECFSSKDELIGTIVRLVLQDYEKQEEDIYAANLPVIPKLRAILTIVPKQFEPLHNRVYDDLRNTYPRHWEQVLAFRYNRMERINAILKQGMAEKIIRPTNLTIFQEIIDSTTTAFLKYQFLSANNITYQDAVNAMLDIIVNGLLVPGAEKE